MKAKNRKKKKKENKAKQNFWKNKNQNYKTKQTIFLKKVNQDKIVSERKLKGKNNKTKPLKDQNQKTKEFFFFGDQKSKNKNQSKIFEKQ